MSRDSILAGVAQVLRDRQLHQGPVGLDTDIARDLQLDSLAQMTLVVELENHFRICFAPGDEAGIHTLGDVVELVASALETAP